MSGLDLIKEINIPKQLLDKSEALLKSLFGESFKEMGGMIADHVRLRRFKNQITIFEKAQKILKDKNIDPKKVSLKVLVPLLEYCSLEEDNNLQEMWSNLTANILENNDDITFHQNSITTMNKLSFKEAKLIGKLYNNVLGRKIEKFNKDVKTDPSIYSIDEYPLESFSFGIMKVKEDEEIDLSTLEYQISNLVILGLLKWETDVEVEASPNNYRPNASIDIDVNVDNNYYFIFTPFGYKFIEICERGQIEKYQ